MLAAVCAVVVAGGALVLGEVTPPPPTAAQVVAEAANMANASVELGNAIISRGEEEMLLARPKSAAAVQEMLEELIQEGESNSGAVHELGATAPAVSPAAEEAAKAEKTLLGDA